MLWYVLIVKVTLVISIEKKKKKKKTEKQPVLWYGSKYQSYATKTLPSIFSLGKGRESLCLQTLRKKLK